jgi:hypothetical protein
VLLVFGAPCQLRLLAGQEHDRTIPLADLIPIPNPVATCLLHTLHCRRPSRFIRLPRPTK